MIEELSSRYPVILMLQVAEINRSGYYRWLNKRMVVSEKSKEDAQVIKCIEKLYIKHYGRYGVERMTTALWADYALKFNHKKVYRLMSQNGYLAVIKVKKRYRKPGDPHPKKNGILGLQDTRREGSGRTRDKEFSIEENYERLKTLNKLPKAENELLKKLDML